MENKVLARVAGREITEKDIETIISRYPAEQRGMFDNPETRKAVLEQAIGYELIYHKGKELKIDETPIYLEQVKNISKEILIQRTVAEVVSGIEVKDEEVKAYYDNNQSEFEEPEKVAAKHILMADENEIKALRERIVAGELTFEEAAREYSTCPSKQADGNLGEFSRGMMVPEFEEVAFNTEVGEISEPVQTQFGFHLIKVEEKIPARVKSFEEVKDLIAKRLLMTAQEEVYAGILTELEAKVGVERL